MLKEFVNNEQEAKKALMGTILADGSIQKERTKAYITKTYVEITHTSKNLDYLKAVKELFEMIPDVTCSIKEHSKNTDNKKYSLYRLTTNSTEYFKEVRDILYTKDRVKLFPKSVIDSFNSLSLLLLYLDDGTLKVRYYEGTSRLREARVTFCLDSFTLNELKYFQEYLKKTYDIDTKVYRHSKNMPLDRGFRIWMNTENTKKFMSIIDKYYSSVPSMQYKFLQFYSL